MSRELGDKLVQQAKREQSLAQLLPYETETVRLLTRQVRDLNKDVAAILEPFSGSFNPSQDPATACLLLVNHLTMRRQKRCLLAYHRVRTGKLERLCWEGNEMSFNPSTSSTNFSGAAGASGGGDGSDGQGQSQVANLSPEEEEYVRAYGELLAGYKGQWTDVDLTGSMEPPRDLFIDVRVLKDAGEIQTEYGAINLTKNSQFYVRQGDVERLIQQGYLQRLG
ncbi:DNA replication complex GINS protein PSF1 [Elsinoe ampelina]|uniref:DNA replication complex GINS protein PSF1 n=1 Tax=Elsinoe ampelina TaxID=302913 RepID=A0A6A6GC12_9PEZI|nr:DNA replication complex GINS protein PSF1 [Elsinoe ampelina]